MTDSPDEDAADLDWSYDDAVLEAGRKRASPAPDLTGQRFADSFEVLEVLGRGGMGIVYRARELTGSRHVALKVLSRTDLAPERLERLRREGQLTAALVHPGIVRVHSAGEVNGLPYVAYELIEGARHLGEVLEGLERQDRVRLLRDVARAIGFAHRNGVTHRDLKPENVLVDPTGRARVVDFGLARAAGLETLTRTGTLVGTPSYMAPEQISAVPGAIGPRTDVWALGVLLYRCLTGELPFVAPGLIELAVRVCQSTPDPPRALDSTVPADLEAVCLKALENDAKARYADADELADDLERALASLPVTASTAWLPHLFRRSRRFAPAIGLFAVAVIVALLALVASAGWRHETRLRNLLNEDRRSQRSWTELKEAVREAPRTVDAALLAEGHLALASRPARSPADWEVRLVHAERARALAKGVSGPADRAVGQALLELGRYAQATEVLTRALSTNADDGLRLIHARAALLSGEPALARRSCEAVLERSPQQRDALGLLTRAHLALGEVDSAREVAKTLATAHPSGDTTVLQAEVAAACGEDVWALLLAARRRWPVHPAPRVALARYLFVAARAPTAARTLLLEGRLNDLGERLLRVLVALDHDSLDAAPPDPDTPEGLRLAGARWLLSEAAREVALARPVLDSRVKPSPDALPTAKHEARALNALRAAIAWAGDSKSGSSVRARAHVSLARLAGVPGDAGEAELEFALSEVPDHPGARVLRAAARAARGEHEGVLADLDDARASVLARSHPRRVVVREGATSAAFGAVEDRRPAESPAAAVLRGWALLALGRDEDALRGLRAAAIRSPDDLQVCAALLAAVQRAGEEAEVERLEARLALLRGASAEEADALYRKLRKTGPITATAVLAAQRRYSRVVALDPLHVRARFDLARCRTLGGDLLDGITDSLREADRDPTLLEQLCYGTQEVSRASLLLYGFGLAKLEGTSRYEEEPLHWAVRGFVSTMLTEHEGTDDRITAGIRDLSAVAEARPSAVWIYVLRGFLWQRLGHLAQAERDLRIADEAAPKMAIVTFYSALIQARRQAPAKEVLETILRARAQGYDPLDAGRHARILPLYPELREYLRDAHFQQSLSRW